MISQDLVERVRGLTGPDREVDALILCALPPFGRNWKPDGCWAGRASFSYADGSKDSRTAPVYTASIDAALALAERALPGWAVTVATYHTDYGSPYADMASRRYIESEAGFEHEYAEAAGATPPLAIVLATLIAIQSSETK